MVLLVLQVFVLVLHMVYWFYTFLYYFHTGSQYFGMFSKDLQDLSHEQAREEWSEQVEPIMAAVIVSEG